MRTSSIWAGLAAALLPALLAPACEAAERRPFEVVKGWEVERTVGDTSANPCLMSHAYEDKEDNNAANAVVFALDGSEAVLVLVYQGWSWDKGEKLKVPFVLDRKVISAKSSWTGDDKTLSAKFPDTIVPNLLAAKTIVLRFKDGEADFDIANFAAGYEALRRCDAGSAKGAAATPTPSQARIRAYALGMTLQTAIKDCDVSTTSKQRAAVDAKMAALQPEMAALEAEIRAEMSKGQGPRCPGAADEPKFQTLMRSFIEKSPEDFSATLDRPDAEARPTVGDETGKQKL